jgi:hypothetical protein
LLTRLADRVWSEGEDLVIERGKKRVRVKIWTAASPSQLNEIYIMVGPALRALGASVRYDAAGRRLIVHIPARTIVASPSPFNAAVPLVAPSAVFTPAQAATPRPIWTGSPLPRRTPLPVPPRRR